MAKDYLQMIIRQQKKQSSQELLQMLIIIPVSYTHLDVYKRQVFTQQKQQTDP